MYGMKRKKEQTVTAKEKKEISKKEKEKELKKT